MLSFTRRVVVREQPPLEVADQPPVYIPEEPSGAPWASAGYRPADCRSKSEDEMSPGPSDWFWHSDVPDFLIKLAPDHSAPALSAQAASATVESRASVESLASVPRSEQQSGVGEAVAASAPEAQPQSMSPDDASGHAAGRAGAEAAPEGIDPQDVYLSVVQNFPNYSADVVTARVAATSATVPLLNVVPWSALPSRRSSRWRCGCSIMIATAVLADPSGWTAYLFVGEEIRGILSRPL